MSNPVPQVDLHPLARPTTVIAGIRKSCLAKQRHPQGSQEAPSTTMSQGQGAGPAAKGDKASPCPLASSSVSTTHPYLPVTEAMVASLKQERGGRKRHHEQSKEGDIYIDAIRRLEEGQATMWFKMEMKFQQLLGKRVKDYPDDCIDFCNSLVPMMKQLSISKRLIFRDRVNAALRDLLSHSAPSVQHPYIPGVQTHSHFQSTLRTQQATCLPYTAPYTHTRATPQLSHLQPVSPVSPPNPQGFRGASENFPGVYPAQEQGSTYVPSSSGRLFQHL